MTLQLVRPISLADVRAEYGAPLGTALGAFVRGGAFVPDTAGNAGVPTVKPISLGDLLGSSAFTVTHTMVAGDTGPLIITGYDTITGPLGSLAPLGFNGEACIRISHNTVTEILTIQLITPGLGQPFWTRMTFATVDPVWNGVTLLSANAAYSDNIFSQWLYPGETRFFLDGVTYELEWL